MEAAKETASNIINAASKMIYGEGEEQQSTGQRSDGLLGDNNSTTTTSNNNNNTSSGQEPLSGVTGSGTTSNPYDAGNTTGEPTNNTTTTTTSSSSSTGQSSGLPSADDTTDTTVPKSSATATSGPDVGAAAPESGTNPKQKQQGADRPREEPSAEESSAIKEKSAAADETIDKSNSAQDDGAPSNERKEGPDSLVGGDSDGQTGSSSDAGPKPLGSGGAAGGGDSDEKDALGSTSNEPGTGEQYVKSSGTKADGGDFDAANPGAGREADRLLEEKGVHREGGNTGPPEPTPASGNKAPGENSVTGSEEKTKFSAKLKEKLHIGGSK